MRMKMKRKLKLKLMIKMKKKNSNSSNLLSWEILNLVAPYLDPKTVAIASCVDKTWRTTMSSDHIWKQICSTYYPSLSLLTLTHPNISYQRLYALGHFSSISRTIRRPSMPSITLNELFFTVDVFKGESHIFSITKAGQDFDLQPNQLFRVEFGVEYDNKPVVLKNCSELRVRWSVVLEGWRGVFMIHDRGREGICIPSYGRWFPEELPSVGCCYLEEGRNGSCMLALLTLRFDDKKRHGEMMEVVTSVGMSFLTVTSWTCLRVEDALRHLKRLLLPSPCLRCSSVCPNCLFV